MFSASPNNYPGGLAVMFMSTTQLCVGLLATIQGLKLNPVSKN